MESCVSTEKPHQNFTNTEKLYRNIIDRKCSIYSYLKFFAVLMLLIYLFFKYDAGAESTIKPLRDSESTTKLMEDFLDIKHNNINCSYQLLEVREEAQKTIQEWQACQIREAAQMSETLQQLKKESIHISKSPLDQFENRDLICLSAPILGYWRISLSNIGLYLTITAFVSLAFSFLATNNNNVVANNWSICQESIYATIHGIVINQINPRHGQIYFPFIFTLFIFILINNLIGMVPYSFASTAHFILTFFMSFTVVLGATILGLGKHGLKLFSLFVPAGCPLYLLPLLVLIEFISYIARNVSLGLRLAANILSGHMLLNILSGFAYNIMTSGFIYFFVGLIPLAFIIAFSGLELGIAFIQAQVFVVLSSSYIKDALDLH